MRHVAFLGSSTLSWPCLWPFCPLSPPRRDAMLPCCPAARRKTAPIVPGARVSSRLLCLVRALPICHLPAICLPNKKKKAFFLLSSSFFLHHTPSSIRRPPFFPPSTPRDSDARGARTSRVVRVRRCHSPQGLSPLWGVLAAEEPHAPPGPDPGPAARRPPPNPRTPAHRGRASCYRRVAGAGSHARRKAQDARP